MLPYIRKINYILTDIISIVILVMSGFSELFQIGNDETQCEGGHWRSSLEVIPNSIWLTIASIFKPN